MKHLKISILAALFLFNHSFAQEGKEDLRYLVEWSKKIHNDSNYCMYLIKYVDTYGPDTSVCSLYLEPQQKDARLNYCAWQIFKKTSNREFLKKAQAWTKPLLRDTSTYHAAFMDTYANILYKQGIVKDAIMIEQEAVNITPDNQFYGQIRKAMVKTLDRMKGGEPTW